MHLCLIFLTTVWLNRKANAKAERTPLNSHTYVLILYLFLFILLCHSHFMNISSHSFAISFFIPSIHLSAAYTFTVITTAPPLPAPLPWKCMFTFPSSTSIAFFRFIFSCQSGWRLSVSSGKKPWKSVCAIMRLISLANDYIHCANMGHMYCWKTVFFPPSTHPEQIYTCMINISVKCSPLCPDFSQYWHLD